MTPERAEEAGKLAKNLRLLKAELAIWNDHEPTEAYKRIDAMLNRFDGSGSLRKEAVNIPADAYAVLRDYMIQSLKDRIAETAQSIADM